MKQMLQEKQGLEICGNVRDASVVETEIKEQIYIFIGVLRFYKCFIDVFLILYILHYSKQLLTNF